MKNETKEILKKALEEIAPMLSKKVDYRDDLVLMGDGVVLDSMSLVSFVSSVETLLSDTFDKDITLVSNKAFSRKNSPFRTMETLGVFIEELLNEAQ
jgi:hypothetical protein